MTIRSNQKTGRNDPCPCGSGKKYKLCCLPEQDATYSFWAQQRDASDQLTRDMMRFAADKFGKQVDDAWQDFNLTDFSLSPDESSDEGQIFMPYFLFHWDPQRPRSGKGAARRVGVVTRWYTLERAGKLSEMDRLLLDQATTQPVSFFEVLSSEPGERISIRDALIGGEFDVIERLGSRSLRRGDIVYGQVWNLQRISILGCMAPICIPPSWKAEVIGLRAKLRKKIAKQNRDLLADDLVRYADEIRLTYLTIRDALNRPPMFANTDGDPVVFHTLTFHIESAESAFKALAPLALGQSKEELLDGAKFGKEGKLRSVAFDWLKKGNAKMSSWDNTILGSIRISGHSLVAEVNSEKRAMRLRAEIEKRLGASVTHQRTVSRAVDEMLAKSPQGREGRPKIDERTRDEFLRDPAIREQLRESIQKQAEAWTHEKVPILGGRTPMEAVGDPEGREIVESLLVQWERRAAEANDLHDIHPDFGALRRILNLSVSTP